MSYVLNGLIGFIAIQHIGFLVLEMFLWTKPIGQKIFKFDQEFMVKSAVMAANQGLYNGFLAAGLVWALMCGSPEMSHSLKAFFLGCIFVAGLYGGLTVSRNILLVQAGHAALALLLLYVS